MDEVTFTQSQEWDLSVGGEDCVSGPGRGSVVGQGWRRARGWPALAATGVGAVEKKG